MSHSFFTFWRVIFFFINLFIKKSIVPRIHDDILLQSATQLARRIRQRELTSEQVVRTFIKRIELVNPILNCVVESTFDQALEQAKSVDALLDAGEAPSEADAPFLGVPYTHKDSIFAKGCRCTAGIPCRRNLVMTESADTIERLNSAGAIHLAVTNVSEVCMFWESYNTMFGRTGNPYDNRRIVGGSSGGEGCLQAAAGAPFGLGSDIGGSIRMPAFFNGIFGHKPSPHVVSLRGSYPVVYGYHLEMLSEGPLCRFAEDLAPMLRVLAGGTDTPNAARTLALFDKDAKKIDFSKMKIFYMEGIDSPWCAWPDTEMINALHKVVRYFETTYGCVSYRLDLPAVHKTHEMWTNDMSLPDAEKKTLPFTVEMMDGHSELNPFKELARFIAGRSVHTLPAILLAIFEKIENVRSEEQKAAGVRAREKLKRAINTLLIDNQAVFLLPSHPMVAPFHCQPIAHPMNYTYTGLFNSLTLPVTQCPMGLNGSGLPLGVQIAAPLFHDAWAIAVAVELEKAGVARWVEPGTN